MSCGWGSNRRSGVALAVPHRHYRFSTYGLKASEREMSTRLHSLSGLWYTLPLWHYGLFLLKAPVKCQSDQSMPNSGTRPSLELSMVNTTVKMEVAIVLLTAMHRQSVQNILVRRRRWTKAWTNCSSTWRNVRENILYNISVVLRFEWKKSWKMFVMNGLCRLDDRNRIRLIKNSSNLQRF